MNGWLLLAGDLLLLAGLTALTLGLVGIWRFGDLFSRLHAAAKVGSLGLAALLAGTIATGDLALVLRALLIAVFLVVTAPVTTHALARSAERREDRHRGD
jgi:multicomponent Na+:H+ antiporter subunit G